LPEMSYAVCARTSATPVMIMAATEREPTPGVARSSGRGDHAVRTLLIERDGGLARVREELNDA